MTTDGYAKTSIAMVCRESGLPVGSVYHHFANKAGLLTAVLQGVEGRFFGGLPGPSDVSVPDRGLGAFWDAAINGITDHLPYLLLDLELARLALDDPALRPVLDGQIRRTHRLIADTLMPYARLGSATDPADVADALAGTLVTFTRGAVLTAGRDRQELRRQMTAFYPLLRNELLGPAATVTAPESATRSPGR
ncbi:TetR/AcrR family transcriptional regulator [Actinoplanes sp. CA-131856]